MQLISTYNIQSCSPLRCWVCGAPCCWSVHAWVCERWWGRTDPKAGWLSIPKLNSSNCRQPAMHTSFPNHPQEHHCNSRSSKQCNTWQSRDTNHHTILASTNPDTWWPRSRWLWRRNLAGPCTYPAWIYSVNSCVRILSRQSAWFTFAKPCNAAWDTVLPRGTNDQERYTAASWNCSFKRRWAKGSKQQQRWQSPRHFWNGHSSRVPIRNKHPNGLSSKMSWWWDTYETTQAEQVCWWHVLEAARKHFGILYGF